MKKKVISEDNKVKISINREPENTFDVSAFETISEVDVKTIYKEQFTHHKNVLLKLAVSRIAFDSAAVSVQNGLSAITNGPAIEIVESGTVDLVNAIYTKAIVNHVLNTSTNIAIDDEELRREIMLSFKERSSPLTSTKDIALGVVKSRDPEKTMREDIEKLQNMIESKLGRDDSPGPFGINKPEPKKGDGKLPVGGVATRKRR